MGRLSESLRPIKDVVAEVIIVDDGSTDGSAELFETYLPYARIIRQNNLGLAGARNRGLRQASGEFVQFLDVDDTLETNKLELQERAGRETNADVVYSDWRMVSVCDDVYTPEPIVHAGAQNDMVRALFDGWWVPPVGYLFRRSAVLELGGFNEEMRVWEDFEFFLRCAIHNKAHYYQTGAISNYHRYLDHASLARRNALDNLLYRERAIDLALDQLRTLDGLTHARRRAVAGALHRLARMAFEILPEDYDRLLTRVYELDPDFSPAGTMAYRLAARMAGIRAADRVARATRHLRRRAATKFGE